MSWIRRWLERRSWSRVAAGTPPYGVRVLLIEAATGDMYIGRWNEAGQYPDDHFVYWRFMPDAPHHTASGH